MLFSSDIERSLCNAERYAEAMDQHNRFVIDEISEGLSYRPPDSTEIQDRLNQIFRASFPVSNGSPLSQFLIQATALRVLKRQSSEDSVISTLEDMPLDPSLYYPPTRHAKFSRRTKLPLSGRTLDERIGEIWEIYVDIAKNGENTKAVTETEEMPEFDWVRFKSGIRLGVEYQNMWKRIAERDVNYLITGRPSGGPDHQKYRSVAKACILDGQNSGSEEVNVVCATARASLKYTLDRTRPQPVEWLSYSVRSSFLLLENLWEARHDAVGEFAPQDFIEYLGKPAITGSISGDGWDLSH